MLEPRSSRVETLARLTDYSDRDLGPAMTTFENDLGGRACIMGYYPWSQMHHLAKSSQMKAVCEWLARDRQPVVLESFARVQLWIREPAPGQLACVLLNASLDPQPSVTLRVKGSFNHFNWFTVDRKGVQLKSAPVPQSQSHRIKTPELKAWSIYLLTAES